MPSSGGKLFVSHSSEDADLAVETAAYLDRLGISCWMALRDIPPGADWAESIINAINSSGAFLLLATDFSFNSGQVKRETEKAASLGMPVIVALFDSAQPPGWLRYHVSGDSLIYFRRDRIREAALRVMLLLQKPSARSMIQNEYLLEETEPASSSAEEHRPFFVLRLSIAAETPLWLQNRILPAAGRLCRSFNGETIKTAVPGFCCGFDSLTPGNAAENATDFALALKLILTEIPKDSWGMGLSSGTAAFSSVNELLRREESVFREAEKLSLARGGQVLASASFRKRCSHLCRFTGNPGEACVLVEEGKANCVLKTTVRKTELEFLSCQLNRLKQAGEIAGISGNTHIVTGVRGEMGSGKSLLAESFSELIRGKSGFRAVSGTPVNSSWPHNLIWQRICEQLSGKEEPPPSVEELEEWCMNLCSLLNRAGSEKRLVIILEDIDRSDTAGLQTFRDILNWEHFSYPLLFVLFYKDSPGEKMSAILTDFHTEELELGPLNREQLEAISGNIGKLAEETLDYLLDFSGGNPLFAQELLADSLGTGRLLETDGIWRLEGEFLQLPPAMEAEAFEALSKLRPLQREILRAGASAGRQFCLKRVMPVFTERVKKETVAFELASLSALGIIRAEGGSFGTSYSFTKSFIRQAVLSTVPPGNQAAPSS